MAIQYKPTKPKKEKPQKTPKAPKAEKPVKLGSAKAVKIEKPKKVKEPKAPKMPKPEKAIAFKPGKVEKAENLSKGNVLKKPVNPKVAVIIVVAIIIVAVVSVAVIVPAVKRYGEGIKRIEISQNPDKIIYLIGEEANYDGLRVLVTRNNGETFTVRAKNCEITGFDSSSAKQIIITVNYQGFTTDFSIKVEEPPRQIPNLTGIHLDPLPKTVYKLGEKLDTTEGVIIREYDDGTTAKAMLLYSNIYGFDGINAPGKYTLNVRYIENGTIAETTYDITVTE